MARNLDDLLKPLGPYPETGAGTPSTGRPPTPPAPLDPALIRDVSERLGDTTGSHHEPDADDA